MEVYPENTIAVVGMACRFPGANSVDEFWDILKTGKSLDQVLPDERIPLAGHWRNPAGMTLRGNFIDNVDAFDHKFFKITSREAASMDPQQRLLLEVAYQALESSGYFGHSDWDPHVGCYIGGFSSDYNDNIASQSVNAYSALGSLKGFQSGRVSHYFQWTGPSIMYDTVCSSSGVAIDAACKAIIAGDCSSAIAGGVSVFTSPFLFQNLAGASFLSPDGKVKPFDIKADGYSRGEGVGIVVLKPLSAAIRAGDPILGIIRSSIVRQSRSPHITVPHSESQAILYRQVLDRAQITPDRVTYIEAHGTGTRIGDTPEYEGIKDVFGGKARQDMLYFSSLKGNIGHAEGASGVASLIKTLLMIQHSEIPPQANFDTLNPRINLIGERIAIPLTLQSWKSEPRVALVNNFGAAGSIAAMIVQEPPPLETSFSFSQCVRFPVCLAANTQQSLENYCRRLQSYIDKTITPTPQSLLADLCFTISRRANSALAIRSSFSVSNIQELSSQLRLVPSVARTSNGKLSDMSPKPVVLIFSGQAFRRIRIPVDIYRSSSVFASHLDECNETLVGLGIPSVAPHIFQDHECKDATTLQTIQFVTQYSCARTWIDCGLKVDCLLGHSLGQLVALVVSGCLSLADGLRYVCGRASLIDSKWGKEKGLMTTINGNADIVQSVISRVNELKPHHHLEIACHNGPNSHVLVGSAEETQALEKILNEELLQIKYKRLDVTHGFHSKLTEPILKDLRMLAMSLTFNNQSIPVEMCSETPTQDIPTAASLVEHTRQPVYFRHAVERIENRLGSCTWMEAGAGSSVIHMLQSASNQRKEHAHDFHPVKFDEESEYSLANTITKLWMEGYGVSFWPFSPSRMPSFRILQIPPYQFDHPRHWIEWNHRMISSDNRISSRCKAIETEAVNILVELQGQIGSTKETVYLVNTKCPEWCSLVKGHRVQDIPICPASLYLALVIRAIGRFPRPPKQSLIPRVDKFRMRTAMGVCQRRQVTLKLIRNGKSLAWEFLFQQNDDFNKNITTAEGIVTLVPEEGLISEFSRAARLLDLHRRVKQAEREDHSTLHGPLVYNLLSRVVQLDPVYHRLDNVSLDERTVRADVLPQKKDDVIPPGETFNTTLDACLQAAPLHLSSFQVLNKPNHTFVCVSIDSIQFSTPFISGNADQTWSLFSHLSTSEKNDSHYDIFALDPKSGEVALIINEVRLSRVPSSLISSNASLNSSQTKNPQTQQVVSRLDCKNSQNQTGENFEASQSRLLQSNDALDHELRELLSSVTDVPAKSIMDSTQLLELGVDSLGLSEICASVQEAFSTPIGLVEVESIRSFRDLSDLLKSRSIIHQNKFQTRKYHAEPQYEIESEATSFQETPKMDSLAQVKQLLKQYIDVPSVLDPSSQLGNLGLDSLLCIELFHDIYGPSMAFEAEEITPQTTLHELCELLFGRTQRAQQAQGGENEKIKSNDKYLSNTIPAKDHAVRWKTPPQELLDQSQRLFQTFAAETGCQGFWHEVYPAQARLLQAYVLEAFERMSADVRSLTTGERLPDISVISKYGRLKQVLLDILREGQLIDYDGARYIRSDKIIDIPTSGELAMQLAQQHPKFALEIKLLQVTGPRLSSFLLGQEEPLQYLFGNAKTKTLLEEVYTSSPLFLVMSKILAYYIERAGSAFEAGRPIRILEIGAGTGGTTSHIIKSLSQKDVPFHYTFTDLSPSLVSLGRRKFAEYSSCMEFSVFDVERPPSPEMTSSFDIVISTLCIHATRDLTRSLTHINQVLQPHGFVALAEFTKRIPWLDCVFGLLDGWWLFEDGRRHALAPAPLWQKSMLAAGFRQAIATGDRSLESQTSRIVLGFKSEHVLRTAPRLSPKLTDLDNETICFDRAGIHLRADIYYPSDLSVMPSRRWPVALVIHGGGHVMLSRKDVPARQIVWLLEHGILPISIDYTLCPELPIVDGALSDVCKAFVWARKELATLSLKHCNIQIDAERIGIVGWSSGGALALTLGWTPRTIGVRPPDAVLAFYCPCDYEDEYWKTPQPVALPAKEMGIHSEYSLLNAIEENPITSYVTKSQENSPLAWIHPSNPRAWIYWHMVRNGQTLPILCKGLPASSSTSLDKLESLENMEQPLPEDVRKFSPYAHMKDGQYTVPTFFVHGTSDSFIPWQQSKRAYDLLCEQESPLGSRYQRGQDIY
ncbi:hypothetical protein N7493_003276 [Penicillium malachiteum]|uniref:Uncharacterized protein n=1 Tax=Penicillium malachiteum TaxID=1324776 RepID=A0AAD6HTJ2_9EURO|nr:hypothetical protein N7493_003276 [Penicillium malachiteum]